MAVLEAFDGPTNMALDLALLEGAKLGASGSRIYRWSKPWLSLGYSQRAEETLLPTCDVPWVRRLTGGGAVLHGHDLTVAVAAPLTASVKDTYRFLAIPLVQALRQCGVPASLAECHPASKRARANGDCFLHTSKLDIVDANGCKIVGVAIRRLREAALLQASIPIQTPSVDLHRIFRTSAPVLPVELRVEAFIDALRALSPSWSQAVQAATDPMELLSDVRNQCH